MSNAVVYTLLTTRPAIGPIMEGTYKLFAAAVIGLALIFGSSEIGNRSTDRPETCRTPLQVPPHPKLSKARLRMRRRR